MITISSVEKEKLIEFNQCIDSWFGVDYHNEIVNRTPLNVIQAPFFTKGYSLRTRTGYARYKEGDDLLRDFFHGLTSFYLLIWPYDKTERKRRVHPCKEIPEAYWYLEKWKLAKHYPKRVPVGYLFKSDVVLEEDEYFQESLITQYECSEFTSRSSPFRSTMAGIQYLVRYSKMECSLLVMTYEELIDTFAFEFRYDDWSDCMCLFDPVHNRAVFEQEYNMEQRFSLFEAGE